MNNENDSELYFMRIIIFHRKKRVLSYLSRIRHFQDQTETNINVISYFLKIGHDGKQLLNQLLSHKRKYIGILRGHAMKQYFNSF